MKEILNKLYSNTVETLLKERNEEGHWRGRLSSSALSTAVAIIALYKVDEHKYASTIQQGYKNLLSTQNQDGGWGDTDKSFSNLSTSLLCWAALNLIHGNHEKPVDDVKYYIKSKAGGLGIQVVREALVRLYGKDKTFAVPILICTVLCGCFDHEKKKWHYVFSLPFELAVLPSSWFSALSLPVVSYALPALIAIGYAKYFHAPPFFPWIRKFTYKKALKKLRSIQPESGGYLEAIPLTAFVTMSLASTDQGECPVVLDACEFLLKSQRKDGSWPIDIDLATWVTTLAIKALPLDSIKRKKDVLDWLIAQQGIEKHPFTHAAPGAWGWTDLSGSVPDADDTAGAVIAIHKLNADEKPVLKNAALWLRGLQNKDGGVPTFCRGWGALPFDRSSPDITAHALRAWSLFQGEMDLNKSIQRAIKYLLKAQQSDGSWLPLWFGNQHHLNEANPIYGTSTVLQACLLFEQDARVANAMKHGYTWLSEQQNLDGGWGMNGHSSIEETSLALEIVNEEKVIEKAIGYLDKVTRSGTEFPPAPIGFYFARLWYYEKLYPMVWACSALKRITEKMNHPVSEVR